MKAPVSPDTAAVHAFRSHTSIWFGLEKSRFAERKPVIQLPCSLFSYEDRIT
jgi:hypothetical protein